MEIGILVFGFIVGVSLGSFVKALADRTVANVSFRGRSYCEECGKQIRWYDLFPVLSYLMLGGRCRNCHKRIPLDNLIVELAMGLISALTFGILLVPNFNNLLIPNWLSLFIVLKLIFSLTVLSILGAIFLVDLKTYIIPDKIVFPSVIIVVGYLLLSSALRSAIFYQEILHSPLGKFLMAPYSNYFLDSIERIWIGTFGNLLSGLGAALFFVLLILITSGRGMGWGDVKYVFLLGLILGFPNIALGLLLAFTIGAIFSLGLIIAKKKGFGQTIPFGPFLSIGTLIAFLFGDQLVNFYLSFSSNLIPLKLIH